MPPSDEPGDEPSDEPALTAAQAAARLGIKVETLYAYVSRGMVERRRAPDGRTSLFAVGEVERLARHGRRAPVARGTEIQVPTALTAIEGGRLRFRGLDAVELAATRSFEWVAEWLWHGRAPDDPPRWRASALSAELIAREVADLPPTATLGDRLRVAAAVAGATHSLRHDLRPAGVAHSGRRLIATMVDSLPLRQEVPPAGDGDPPAPLAARLWPRLGPEAPTPERLVALDAALVLLADHELASSTLAARVAASTRADPYAVVGAGLAVLSGSLHGTASLPVQRMLAELDDASDLDRAGAVVAEHLRPARHVPGFGHPLYPEGDPRAVALLERVRAAGPPERLAAVDAVHAVMAEGAPAQANVDFGVAALCHVAGFDLGAGEAVVAVARAAGWLAHAIEEYDAPGNRYRARAHLIGPHDHPPS